MKPYPLTLLLSLSMAYTSIAAAQELTPEDGKAEPSGVSEEQEATSPGTLEELPPSEQGSPDDSMIRAEAGNERGENVGEQATPAPATSEPEEGFAGPRFRWGLSLLGGPLVGGYSGGAGGIDARFGAQVSETLAIYAQPMFLLGAGASANAEGASASAIAVYGVGALAEVTLLDMFYVGLGPEIVRGAMGTASASTTGASAEGSAGSFFSVASRAGLALGKTSPTRRHGLTIGLDMRIIFASRTAVVPLVALGYDAF